MHTCIRTEQTFSRSCISYDVYIVRRRRRSERKKNAQKGESALAAVYSGDFRRIYVREQRPIRPETRWSVILHYCSSAARVSMMYVCVCMYCDRFVNFDK